LRHGVDRQTNGRAVKIIFFDITNIRLPVSLLGLLDSSWVNKNKQLITDFDRHISVRLRNCKRTTSSRGLQ